MSGIITKGEKVRQAVRWISEQLKECETRPLSELIQKAGYTFNLSPKEEEELRAFYNIR